MLSSYMKSFYADYGFCGSVVLRKNAFEEHVVIFLRTVKHRQASMGKLGPICESFTDRYHRLRTQFT